jgi:Cof subfamily protein (haloacid dehalogenase superfamily)
MPDDGDAVTRPISAVLADVDGTMVTKEKVLTPRAIQAVRELQDRGVLFAITSGRPPRGMMMLVEPLRMRGPMAAFNGAIVLLPDMTIVDERPIPPAVVQAVIATIRAHELDVWVYRATEWYVMDPNGPRVAREAGNVQFQPTVVPTYDGLHEGVVKIVGVSFDHDLVARCEAEVRRLFTSRVSASRSQPYYLDVTHPTANKGVVIERLSKRFQIPLDQIATLGDQLNDVLMFERSGLSIAMGNASEEVRRQATHVTSSNEEDGFAEAIERLVLPRAAPHPVPPPVE